MAVLDREMAAYTNRKDELEANYHGRWVVFHDDEFVSALSDTLDEAAVAAAKRFGLGPYLIRQVGAPAPRLSSSVLYRRMNMERQCDSRSFSTRTRTAATA